MTDPAVPIPNVDTLHAHFAEWVWYLDAKDVELTAQQAKLEAKKVKTRAAVPAKPLHSEPLETSREKDFLDYVFRAQTHSGLETVESEEQAELASEETRTTQDDLAQDVDSFESPTEEAHGPDSTVTSPKISTVEDDELS